MAPRTLVMLGAGSISTLRTVYHICQHARKHGPVRVRLCSRTLGRVAIVARLCRLMPEFDPECIEVTVADDLTKALEGADAVYCLLRTSADRDRNEKAISLEHGMHSDPTFGPGSVTLALRQGPVVLDLARQMERLCPAALLFIFTNPVTILTDLVRRNTTIKAIGLCSGVENIKSDMLHLHYDPPGPLTGLAYRGGGLNHFSWVTRDSTFRGVPLGDYLAGHIRTLDDSRICPWCLWPHEKRVFEFTGQMPMNNGHLYHFFFYDEVVAAERARLAGGQTASVAGHDPWPERERLSRQTRIADYWATFGVTGNDCHVECPGTKAMFSYWHDLGWEVGLNVPNQGHVAGLPEGCVVEATCRVTARGCEPLGLDPIPACVQGLTRAVAEHQRLVADLIIKPSLKGFEEALFADPCLRNLERIKRVADRLWNSLAAS